MHAYVSLRKQVLGVDELHFYDIYAPMVSDMQIFFLRSIISIQILSII